MRRPLFMLSRSVEGESTCRFARMRAGGRCFLFRTDPSQRSAQEISTDTRSKPRYLAVRGTVSTIVPAEGSPTPAPVRPASFNERLLGQPFI